MSTATKPPPSLRALRLAWRDMLGDEWPIIHGAMCMLATRGPVRAALALDALWTEDVRPLYQKFKAAQAAGDAARVDQVRQQVLALVGGDS